MASALSVVMNMSDIAKSDSLSEWKLLSKYRKNEVYSLPPILWPPILGKFDSGVWRV